MAEFVNNEYVTVKPGENISFGDVLVGNREHKKWKISYTYEDIRTGKTANRVMTYNHLTKEEAYQLWRSENWENLFDPFSIRILHLDIRIAE